MMWWTLFRNALREWKPDPRKYDQYETELKEAAERASTNKDWEDKAGPIVTFFKKYDQITGTYWPKDWETKACCISLRPKLSVNDHHDTRTSYHTFPLS